MRAVSQLILGVRSAIQARVKIYNKGTPGTGARVSVVARREGDFVVHVRAADSGSRGDVLVAVSPCREARVGAF